MSRWQNDDESYGDQFASESDDRFGLDSRSDGSDATDASDSERSGSETTASDDIMAMGDLSGAASEYDPGSEEVYQDEEYKAYVADWEEHSRLHPSLGMLHDLDDNIGSDSIQTGDEYIALEDEQSDIDKFPMTNWEWFAEGTRQPADWSDDTHEDGPLIAEGNEPSSKFLYPDEKKRLGDNDDPKIALAMEDLRKDEGTRGEDPADLCRESDEYDDYLDNDFENEVYNLGLLREVEYRTKYGDRVYRQEKPTARRMRKYVEGKRTARIAYMQDALRLLMVRRLRNF